MLYEAATGRHPFPAASPARVLAAILRDTPAPPSTVSPRIDPEFDRIVARAMAKDPSDRYQHAAALADDLRGLRRRLESSPSGPATPVTAGMRTVALAAWAAVAIAALSAGAFLVWRARQPTPIVAALEAGRLTSLLSAKDKIFDPCLSADGRMLAYVAREAGRTDLYVQRTSGGRRLRLTDDGALEGRPSFSPDGEQIVFSRVRPETGVREILRIPSLGGAPTKLADHGTSPAWSPRGDRIAFVHHAPGEPARLETIGTDGGARTIWVSARYIF
jgi:hypothetical protein